METLPAFLALGEGNRSVAGGFSSQKASKALIALAILEKKSY